MYKQGSTQELISEYYAYQLLNAMDVSVAEYQIHRTVTFETGLESACIITKDFTENAKTDFEPFCNYYTDHEDADYILARLDPKLHEQYVMMLFYDALLYNGDRHNQNVGFLRNSSTGEIISLAPYFDFNLCLAAVSNPYINAESGNLYTRDFLSIDICRKILKANLPDKALLEKAIRAASDETKKAFPKENFRYALFEEYILYTYDYLAAHI